MLPAMEFTWQTVTGKTVHQIRLNNPITGKDGHEIRYLFGDGVSGLIGVDPAFADHQDDTRIPAMLVEGTKQFLAAFVVWWHVVGWSWCGWPSLR